MSETSTLPSPRPGLCLGGDSTSAAVMDASVAAVEAIDASCTRTNACSKSFVKDRISARIDSARVMQDIVLRFTVEGEE